MSPEVPVTFKRFSPHFLANEETTIVQELLVTVQQCHCPRQKAMLEKHTILTEESCRVIGCTKSLTVKDKQSR